MITTSTTYQGSLVSTRTATANGQILRKWEYTHDVLNRISGIRETDATGTTTISEYAYGTDGRLSQVRINGNVVESYSYDMQGNRVMSTNPAFGEASATFDARDRILSNGSTSYDWNKNGALSEITGASGTKRFEYDQRGNLLKAILEDGRVVEYRIDARDRRVGKLVDGIPQEGFIYKDQLNPIAWLDGNGGTKAVFVYGDRSNIPGYMVMGGENYRFVTDHLGSVRMVVNATTGVVVQEMDYDSYGNILRNTNPGFQPFGFAGGLFDAHTGLVKFGARDYDPEIGRWTSVDPIRFKGGLNLYAYCENNPINWIDVTGYDPKTVLNCLNKMDKCVTGPDNANLDEECVLQQCTWNYEKCQSLDKAGLGNVFDDRDPKNYCDENGAKSNPSSSMSTPECGIDNGGKTTQEEYDKNKKNQKEICIEKTVKGACEACFMAQGQPDRVQECLGF